MTENDLIVELHYELLTRWGEIVDFDSTEKRDEMKKDDILDFLRGTAGFMYGLTKKIESSGLFTESNIYIMKKRHLDEWDRAKDWQDEEE